MITSNIIMTTDQWARTCKINVVKIFVAQSFTYLPLLHLAGALLEHFLEGIAPLKHCYISPKMKSNKYNSFLLS